MEDNLEAKIKNSLSRYDNKCEGFFSSDKNNYFIALNLSAAKVKKKYSHLGSEVIDFTNAYDLAEVTTANIGQTNMIQVSSFCGPMGVLWGYHVVKSNNLKRQHPLLKDYIKDLPNFEIYSAQELFRATQLLYGKNNQRRFSIMPGSHLPCAYKSIKSSGKCRIYAALAFGIAENATENANLIMEDIGKISLDENKAKLQKTQILINLTNSFTDISNNQNVKYREIFLDIQDIIVEADEVGCVLVACPYFKLAKKAIPNNNIKDLIDLDLDSWNKLV